MVHPSISSEGNSNSFRPLTHQVFKGCIYVSQALFKARFEQALESQKLNIKKTEQQLRRMGWPQRSSMQSTRKKEALIRIRTG
ncbi:unnamed protein product [Brassica rapa subsp. trilocularis]